LSQITTANEPGDLAQATRLAADAERNWEEETPRFAVWGGRVNLPKQVEPLLSVALQASSQQRHAQHATSRLT